MNRRLLLTYSLLLICAFCYGQKENDSLFVAWQNTSLSDSLRAAKYRTYIYKYYVNRKADSAYALSLDLLDFTKQKQLNIEQANALMLLSDISKFLNDNETSVKYIKQSLKIFETYNYKPGIAKALLGIGVSYRRIYNLDEAKNFYEQSLEISTAVNDSLIIARALHNIGFIYVWRYKSDTALEYFFKSLAFSESIDTQDFIGKLYLNIGNAYEQKKAYVKANVYYSKAQKIGDSLQNNRLLASVCRSIGNRYRLQHKYDEVIQEAKKMNDYATIAGDKELVDGSYYLFVEAYKGKRNLDSILKYLSLRKEMRTTIDDINSVKTLNKLKIDNTRSKDSLINVAQAYQTEIAFQKQKTNLTIAWGAVLAGGILIAFIIYRKIKRKQRKAEEERQKQIEEKEKILKDLELQTIDAMIAGQEKERERLASDLHDSVGATLSAAKLQFNYLIKDEIDSKVRKELIKKTSTLLEDAYVEIRSMAHLKNSGVMAKNGLLPAVKKLSQNASGINGLSFDVQSFGLEQRLDNALEISIFRIIQELVTNIIKHAQATQGVIHLTNHHETFNIMVEDNGIGFKPNQTTTTSSGMGLSSIDKRIAHLEGKLNIESKKNKGTTIIIDIPL